MGERREATTQERADTEVKCHNMERAAFTKNIKASRDLKREHAEALDSRVEAAQSPLVQ